MRIPSWYVITGGPSSGKTTLVKKLSELGHWTVPEAARSLIDEHLSKGISVEELRRDEISFQKMIFQKIVQNEKNVIRDKTVFFDRGLPDNLAYRRFYGEDVQQLESLAKNRYRKIFFLDELPFEKDYARTEDGATAKALASLLLQYYRSLGYEVLCIPAVSVEARAKLVLSNL